MIFFYINLLGIYVKKININIYYLGLDISYHLDIIQVAVCCFCQTSVNLSILLAYIGKLSGQAELVAADENVFMNRSTEFSIAMSGLSQLQYTLL